MVFPGMRALMRGCVVAGLVLLAAGCDRGMGDLEAYVAEVKARKSSDIEPIPEVHAFAPYLYEPGDRRDPFRALEFALEGPAIVSSGIRPDLTRNREPLEAFPLDALRMVGTLQMQGTMYALIRGGDGIVHRVTLGNYVGRNYGKITEVSGQEVQIVEIVQDGFGGYMEQPNRLTLVE
ncbi:MAG: pilus assembly protein PilP [Nevskiales bacterium]